MVRRTLAWLLWFIVAIYVVVLGFAVIWAWSDGGAASLHFHTHFDGAEKEEVYITELEEVFDCESDDDREVAGELLCWQKVNKTFISAVWLDILMLAYIIGHALFFLIIPFVNKQFYKNEEDDYMTMPAANNKLIEA
uniref:Uncharacterized protein n=1 Tax=Caenorhabditis japonica TaxID=281687 RepID=A0A8R1IG55_CAEJA